MHTHPGAFVAEGWKDYALLDAGYGQKWERWGSVTVVRPDPQIIWPPHLPHWEEAHMHYHRSSKGGGQWEHKKKTPGQWRIAFDGMSFIIRPTDFKHMGLFPEQAANWRWVKTCLQRHTGGASNAPQVLNLFGYTGAATVACLAAGAHVTHVDAAKGMNQWAKENIQANGFTENFRVLTDDVYKFVQREIRRGRKYDGIIMDPPSYGRGPGGEVWKLEDKLYELLQSCRQILSAQPLFFLLNAYTAGFTPVAAENVLAAIFDSPETGQQKNTGVNISAGALGIPIGNTGRILPCGMSARVTFA